MWLIKTKCQFLLAHRSHWKHETIMPFGYQISLMWTLSEPGGRTHSNPFIWNLDSNTLPAELFGLTVINAFEKRSLDEPNPPHAICATSECFHHWFHGVKWTSYCFVHRGLFCTRMFDSILFARVQHLIVHKRLLLSCWKQLFELIVKTELSNFVKILIYNSFAIIILIH